MAVAVASTPFRPAHLKKTTPPLRHLKLSYVPHLFVPLPVKQETNHSAQKNGEGAIGTDLLQRENSSEHAHDAISPRLISGRMDPRISEAQQVETLCLCVPADEGLEEEGHQDRRGYETDAKRAACVGQNDQTVELPREKRVSPVCKASRLQDTRHTCSPTVFL